MKSPSEHASRLTVVIAAWSDPTSLVRCLDSLHLQLAHNNGDAVVVSNYDTATVADSLEDGSRVHFVQLPEHATVPSLFAEGIAQASGDVIAMTEDFSVFDASWSTALLKAYDDGRSAVGSAVEHARVGGPTTWAVYFFEYGRFMSPFGGDSPPGFSEFNASCRRDVLSQYGPSGESGWTAYEFQRTLGSSGIELSIAKEAVIYHFKTYSLQEASSSFYQHGRSFAGRRFSRRDMLRNGLFALAALLLPIVLTARVCRTVFRKGRCRKELLLSIFPLAIVAGAWSVGEIVGYVAGPGQSPDRWR